MFRWLVMPVLCMTHMTHTTGDGFNYGDNYNHDDDSWMWSCMNGTSLGDKLEGAYNQCFGEMAMRISNAQNRQECPSQDDVMTSMTLEYADDTCMLYGIGWISNDGSWDNATIAEDMMSLDQGLLEGLDQQGWEGCVADQTEFWSQHPCANEYEGYVHQIGKMIIEYECFKEFFGNACFDFLYEQDEDAFYTNM